MRKGTTFMTRGIYSLLVFALLFMVSCKKVSEVTPSDSNVTAELTATAAKEKIVAYIKANNIAPRIKRDAVVTSGNHVGKIANRSQSLDLSTNADFKFNQDVINRVINPDDYECGPTYVDGYLNQSIQNWTDNDFTLYYYFGNVAFDYVYVFANTDGGQYFGTTGQFTNVTNRSFNSLLRFWNIPTDILLRDAHGNIFADEAKVKSILLLYGYPDSDATYFAGLLKVAMGSAAFMNYNHPLLTFNAFAATPDPFFGTPKKIVMGDGIQQMYEDLGFGDVATQGILAHEYGHHVQFAKNVDFGSGPEGTRRTELMADAFAGYFLTHKHGAAINWKRVQQFLEVSYGIGDCGFTSSGHHGTPNQRMKAAAFGYKVANDAQKQGKILTSEEFILLFDAELPTILAPDAN